MCEKGNLLLETELYYICCFLRVLGKAYFVFVKQTYPKFVKSTNFLICNKIFFQVKF